MKESAMAAFSQLCEKVIERLRRRLGEIHGDVPSASTLGRIAIPSRGSVAPRPLAETADFAEIPRRGLAVQAKGPGAERMAQSIAGLGFIVSQGAADGELLIKSPPSMIAKAAAEGGRRWQEALVELREARRRTKKMFPSIDWRSPGGPSQTLSQLLAGYEKQAEELMEARKPAPRKSARIRGARGR